MHDFERPRGLLTELHDLIAGQRRVPAIDVPDDVRVRLQHHVLIDQARSRDRWPSGVNRALDAILPRPQDHLPRRLPVLHATQPDFSQDGHARRRQFFEVFFDHAMLDHRCPAMNPYPTRAERRKYSLRKYRHRLDAHHVARPPGCVHLAGRYHRGHSAVEIAVDPAELVLARRPISGHRMHMTVNQSRRQRRSFRIDRGGGPCDIHVPPLAHRRDLSIHSHYDVGIQNWLAQISREQQPNVADDQLVCTASRLSIIIRHGETTFRRRMSQQCALLLCGPRGM